MLHPSRRRVTRALATCALPALLAAPSAQALTGTQKPPTFPAPASERVASERVQPAAAGGAVAPTATTHPTATTPPTAAGAASTPPGASSPQPAATSQAPTQARARRTTKLSDAAIAAAAVAALLALACAAWAIARLQAYEPHWTLSLRHAMAEAGFRASATWAEFSDWVRAGH